MTVIEAIANPARVRKLAQLAMFLPSVIQVRELAVSRMPAAAEDDRRVAVLAGMGRLVESLSGRGYVGSDLQVGLADVIADLYDSVVEAGAM